MQSALTVERQVASNTTVSVTYTNSHGLHMLRSEEFNAPGPVYLMESSGLYNQNQLITNVNARLNANMSLFGYYTLNRAMSNTDGLGTFPAKPLHAWPASTVPPPPISATALFIGGSLNTKWNVRLSPFIVVQSGAPYNITVGQDIYGDTLFNARPGIPTDLTKPGLIDTIYGWLDPNPVARRADPAAQLRAGPRPDFGERAAGQDVGLRTGTRRLGAAARPHGRRSQFRIPQHLLGCLDQPAL